MKVFYSRVSTEDQKIDRQMKNLEGFDYVLSDYCSGSIPIWERPKGSEIKKLIIDQIDILSNVASKMSMKVTHVKPFLQENQRSSLYQ